MISKKLEDMIMPYLKMDIPKRYHYMIYSLLGEVYLVHENGLDLVCIRSPDTPYMCLRYNAINGAYYDVELWNIVKQKGDLL